MIREAHSFQLDQLLAAAGEDVTFNRGEVSVAVRAIVGQSNAQQVGDPVSVNSATTDFIIRADALLEAGIDGVPRRSDSITYNGETYKLTPYGGESEWRYTSPHRLAYRIHTQRTQ